MRNTIATTCLTVTLAAAAGCVDPQTSLGHLMESRRLSAELLVQFAKVNEAGHRAVMANSPEAASAAVKDVTAATESIERDAAALERALNALNYSREIELLAEFRTRFAEFRTLDREILELAELDTNVSANISPSAPRRNQPTRCAMRSRPSLPGRLPTRRNCGLSGQKCCRASGKSRRSRRRTSRNQTMRR